MTAPNDVPPDGPRFTVVRRYADLVGWTALALAALAVNIVPAPTWLRVLLGMPLVLLLPGLGLLELTHPHRSEASGNRKMANQDRLPWAVVLSMLVTLAAGLVLDATARISQANVASSLAGITVLACVVAAILRATRSRTPTPTTRFRLPRTLAEWSSLALVAVLLVGVAALTFDLARDAAARPYTALGFVDPAGLSCHPLEWREDALRYTSTRPDCGALATLAVGIANHEGEPQAYRLVAAWDLVPGDGLSSPAAFLNETLRLDDFGGLPGTFQRIFVITPSQPPEPLDGSRVYLKVALFEDDASSPARVLQVRVDVK